MSAAAASVSGCDDLHIDIRIFFSLFLWVSSAMLMEKAMYINKAGRSLISVRVKG